MVAIRARMNTMNPEDEIPLIQPKVLPSLIEELNTQLLDESAAVAARAFNLGCLLSGLVVGVVVTVTWLLSHWVTAFVTLVMTVLIGVGVSSLVALRARNTNMMRIYRGSITPKMQEIISESELDSLRWRSLVDETLPDDALLRLMMDKFALAEN